jgi:uncharacterized protein
MDFRDKVCVVTGASSGIGRQTAVDLAGRGAFVCAAARREDRLRALVDELDGHHSYVAADLSKPAGVEALARHVRAEYGRCDVLINNAGISLEGPFDGPDAIARLEQVMAINFFAAARLTAELIDLLFAAAPSHVVNVASVAGHLPVAGSSGYCASKFALAGWSESLHLELAPRGVFVTCIDPGPLPTEGFPQTEMFNDRLFRMALTTDAHVSAAICSAIARRKMERFVPRWYYLLQFPRLICPPFYRLVQNRVITRRAARSMNPD